MRCDDTGLDELRASLRSVSGFGDRVLLDGRVLCPCRGCEAEVSPADDGGHRCANGHDAKVIHRALYAEHDAEVAEQLRDIFELHERRKILLASLEPSPEPIALVDRDAAMLPDLSPRWPTALEGEPTILACFRGVTFLTGGPSAGKSWWAIGSSISAARSGWRVLYLASEMHPKNVMERAVAYCDGPVPDGWDIVQVDYGASVAELVGRVCEYLDGRRMLIVLDSINSFVDQSSVSVENSADVHRIGPLKQIVMWALNVRRATEGSVSFLMLSEKNAAGETKGRFGDHKADMVCTIEVDRDRHLVRKLAVVKSWHSETGPLGIFGLDPQRARLTRIGDA